jgi:hypothetical protein
MALTPGKLNLLFIAAALSNARARLRPALKTSIGKLWSQWLRIFLITLEIPLESCILLYTSGSKFRHCVLHLVIYTLSVPLQAQSEKRKKHQHFCPAS